MSLETAESLQEKDRELCQKIGDLKFTEEYAKAEGIQRTQELLKVRQERIKLTQKAPESPVALMPEVVLDETPAPVLEPVV